MKRGITFATILFTALLVSACGDSRRKPAGALVVYADRVAVIGHARVQPSVGRSGMTIDPWQPGNVAVFRVDSTATGGDVIRRSFSGKEGKVYWINQEYKLEEIGQADLSKEDEEIARRFGVEPNQ